MFTKCLLSIQYVDIPVELRVFHIFRGLIYRAKLEPITNAYDETRHLIQDTKYHAKYKHERPQ